MVANMCTSFGCNKDLVLSVCQAVPEVEVCAQVANHMLTSAHMCAHSDHLCGSVPAVWGFCS